MSEGTVPDIDAVLLCPMRENDAGAATFVDYLIALLEPLWVEAEAFSGKRPFGNSDWQWRAYESFVDAGLFEGVFDEDGYLEEFDPQAADVVIVAAIRSLGSRVL